MPKMRKEKNMATKKTAVQKGAGSKTPSKRKSRAGDRYVCDACGLAITVDEDCCCMDPCDLLCCDMPMRKRRSSK